MSNKYVSSRIKDEEKYIKKVSNTAKRLGRPRKSRSMSPASSVSSMSSMSSAHSMPKTRGKKTDMQRSGGFLPLLGMAARFALPILASSVASSVAEPVLSSIVKKISGGSLIDKKTGRRASKQKHAEFITMYLDKNPHHVEKLFGVNN